MGTQTHTRPGEHWLGSGIYDIAETARIVGRHPETIAGWIRGDNALHQVKHDRIMSFLDLISIWVISELIRRGVPRREIRNGGAYVARHVGTDYPFAHKDLATVGEALFGDFGDWVDVGKGGQRSFQIMIEGLLAPIEFGRDLLASAWRPAAGIRINPEIQAGAPCIDGTRVPTRVIADLDAAGGHIEDIADDLNLDVEQVNAALRFERAA